MTVVIVLIILFLIWLIFGSRISAWINNRIQRFIANRTEDFIRKAAGMPPRDKNEKSQQRRQSRENETYRSREYYDPDGPIIPKEYAEDVEFTEIKEFSQTDIDARFDNGTTISYHESQVSDVEWVEVRPEDENKSSKRWKK